MTAGHRRAAFIELQTYPGTNIFVQMDTTRQIGSEVGLEVRPVIPHGA